VLLIVNSVGAKGECKENLVWLMESVQGELDLALCIVCPD